MIFKEDEKLYVENFEWLIHSQFHSHHHRHHMRHQHRCKRLMLQNFETQKKKNKFNKRRNYYFLVKVLLMIKSKPLWHTVCRIQNVSNCTKIYLTSCLTSYYKSISNKIETGSLNRKSHQHNDYKQNYSNRCSLEQNYCSSNKIIVVHAIITVSM